MTSLAPDLDHILAHTRELWEDVRGQNMFVTGGTGFFGRWLLESFAHANRTLDLRATMVVLSRNPDLFRARAPHLEVEFVTGDVRQLREALLPGRHFDYVIHAATESATNLNAEDPLRMIDTIVSGTRAVLEFAVASGARRFLLTSSGAVYGRQPSDLTHIPEDYAGAPDCTDPASAYGEGKRLAELLCACFHRQHGIETVIARCFAFVGPFLPLGAHFAIGNFIRDALAGGPIRVGGDGTPFRSYLYAADLAIWLWTILFKGEAMRPYNVGSAHDLTILQLAATVRDVLGGEIVVAKEPDPKRAPTRYVPSNLRALSELQLQEHINLPEAIRRTARLASLS